jgi:aryl-alcohol dehydrogenase-like predicted oxidoreductase
VLVLRMLLAQAVARAVEAAQMQAETEVGATPAQIALAWLLAQGTDIAPIPGTRRVAYVEGAPPPTPSSSPPTSCSG